MDVLKSENLLHTEHLLTCTAQTNTLFEEKLHPILVKRWVEERYVVHRNEENLKGSSVVTRLPKTKKEEEEC